MLAQVSLIAMPLALTLTHLALTYTLGFHSKGQSQYLVVTIHGWSQAFSRLNIFRKHSEIYTLCCTFIHVNFYSRIIVLVVLSTPQPLSGHKAACKGVHLQAVDTGITMTIRWAH